MKTLYRIKFTHYGPKDTKAGIETYLIAEDEEAVLKWLSDENHILHSKDDLQEEMTIYCVVKEDSEDWNRAQKLEVKILSEDEIHGSRINLIRFLRGEFDEVYDAYYGITQFSWEAVSFITDEDIKTLVRLEVASVL